jgi:hypothetical protein
LSWKYARSRAFLRVVSKTQLAIFEQTTRTGADRRRLVPGMTFEIVSRVHAKQKFVQQHSGDWAMTGRCPSRVRLNSFCPHQSEG